LGSEQHVQVVGTRIYFGNSVGFAVKPFQLSNKSVR
jgi:hypothetical protein